MRDGLNVVFLLLFLSSCGEQSKRNEQDTEDSVVSIDTEEKDSLFLYSQILFGQDCLKMDSIEISHMEGVAMDTTILKWENKEYFFEVYANCGDVTYNMNINDFFNGVVGIELRSINPLGKNQITTSIIEDMFRLKYQRLSALDDLVVLEKELREKQEVIYELDPESIHLSNYSTKEEHIYFQTKKLIGELNHPIPNSRCIEVGWRKGINGDYLIIHYTQYAYLKKMKSSELFDSDFVIKTLKRKKLDENYEKLRREYDNKLNEVGGEF